jgi:hypothetical protein
MRDQRRRDTLLRLGTYLGAERTRELDRGAYVRYADAYVIDDADCAILRHALVRHRADEAVVMPDARPRAELAGLPAEHLVVPGGRLCLLAFRHSQMRVSELALGGRQSWR